MNQSKDEMVNQSKARDSRMFWIPNTTDHNKTRLLFPQIDKTRRKNSQINKDIRVQMQADMDITVLVVDQYNNEPTNKETNRVYHILIIYFS